MRMSLGFACVAQNPARACELGGEQHDPRTPDLLLGALRSLLRAYGRSMSAEVMVRDTPVRLPNTSPPEIQKQIQISDFTN